MTMSFSKLCIATLALVAPQGILGDGHTIPYKITVKVESKAPPTNGTCITPVWVGIHTGMFDTYSGGEPLPDFMEALVEDGDTGPVTEAFANSTDGLVDATIGAAPYCNGEMNMEELLVDLPMDKAAYFSYASMVIPSNDAFVSNGNPMEHMIIDEMGAPKEIEIAVMGSEVLDAGTEVNDEMPDTTAGLGQSEPNTGIAENSTVMDHLGFMQNGTILAAKPGGDFTTDGYSVMMITVTAEKIIKPYKITVKVENDSPINGTCVTPVWVGVHTGMFDTYSGGEPLPDFMERLVEDGNTAPVTAAFEMADDAVADATIGTAPVCPSEMAMGSFTAYVRTDTKAYFSYASMVIPSNDAFVANGNPTEHTLFDEMGMPRNLTITVLGTDVLDAGTEVNDEMFNTTAGLGQSEPNTGTTESENVMDHPGFMEDGPILTAKNQANFMEDGYGVMTITVMVEEAPDAPEPTSSPSPGMDPGDDSSDDSAAMSLGLTAFIGALLGALLW